MEAGEERPRRLAHIVALQGDLGLREASQVQDLLREALSAARAVELDVRGITGLDISIVQLIAAARRSAQQRGGSLSLVSEPNSIFATTVTRAGLLRLDGVVRTADEGFWSGRASAGGSAS